MLTAARMSILRVQREIIAITLAHSSNREGLLRAPPEFLGFASIALLFPVWGFLAAEFLSVCFVTTFF